jgi:PAS domain S-box-containing protein
MANRTPNHAPRQGAAGHDPAAHIWLQLPPMHTSRDETAARLAAIVESSDDAIVGKDLNGYITSWNAGAERMFGYMAAEVVGRHISLIIPAERRSEEDHVISEIRHGRRVQHFETVRQHKDGRLLDISLTVSPIRTAGGDIIGASKIARDITEQKRLQRAAEEASRSKDEFLATLSHELRTPLNTVLGYTHMLQNGTLEPSVMTKALDAITRNAQALTKLVNDVLDVSRIVTGKMRLNLQRCDLAAVANEAIDTIRPAVAARSLKLQVELGQGMIVYGDPDRLRQILWNLLANAAKFTPTGGTISLRGSAGASDVMLEVVDTGSGIPPEALPRVFEHFWQADSTHTRGHSGLGLGLALVRHLVELHGGRVRAESGGAGKGARFEVTIPRLADPESNILPGSTS